MTNFTLGRWLLVAVAVLGLALAVPVVSAHGDDAATGTTTTDFPANNATAAQWTAWMDDHMTDHMGPGSVEWMESHMGVSIEQMGQYMADNDAPYMYNGTQRGADGMDGYGMRGNGGYGMGGYGMGGHGGYGMGGYGLSGNGGYGMGGYGMGC